MIVNGFRVDSTYAIRAFIFSIFSLQFSRSFFLCSDSDFNDRIKLAARLRTTAFVGFTPASSIAGIVEVKVSKPSFKAFLLFFSAFRCRILFLSSGSTSTSSLTLNELLLLFDRGSRFFSSMALSESDSIASELEVEAA